MKSCIFPLLKQRCKDISLIYRRREICVDNIMSKKAKAIQIIKGRLFWISDNEPPKNIPKSFYFNIDNDLTYDSFNQDFGPLNLAKTWKYVTELQKLMSNADYKTSQIYHYTGTKPQKAANAAFLVCAFTVISLGYTATEAFRPFENIAFRPFRDAGYNECTYKCTILDCLRGLEYGITLGWFNHKTFNLTEYQHYEKIEHGDLNWIIPNKFVAFSSPSPTQIDSYGNRTLTPSDYVPIFKKLKVSCVVRLNNKTYEANDFIKEGIRHVDLYFADGSVPSMDIVQKFLDIAQTEKGAIAVHCKAGLGRTGTLIALYSMKHYYFPAADFIGWIRIARPGSILGPQQNYLIEMQKAMRDQGVNSPIWRQIKEIVEQKDLVHRINNVNVQMSHVQKQIMSKGQFGQGEGLVEAKLKKQQALKSEVSREKSSSITNKQSPSSNKYSNVIRSQSQSKK